MLEQIQPWLSVILWIALGIVFLYCIYLQNRVNRLHKRYDYFMKGEDSTSLERKLALEVKEIRETAAVLDELFKEQERLKGTQESTIQKIGFVKYNAFDNIGNNLSFALTLLDGNSNGICISSVYGRNETRIFSKPIVNGKSLTSLSQEELQSLTDALGDKTNAEALLSGSVAK